MPQTGFIAVAVASGPGHHPARSVRPRFFLSTLGCLLSNSGCLGGKQMDSLPRLAVSEINLERGHQPKIARLSSGLRLRVAYWGGLGEYSLTRLVHRLNNRLFSDEKCGRFWLARVVAFESPRFLAQLPLNLAPALISLARLFCSPFTPSRSRREGLISQF